MNNRELVEEALRTIETRGKSYDPPIINFSRIAAGWESIFGCDVTPEQVAMAFIWTKICREVAKHQDDNILDMMGYVLCLNEVIEYRNKMRQSGIDIE